MLNKKIILLKKELDKLTKNSASSEIMQLMMFELPLQLLAYAAFMGSGDPTYLEEIISHLTNYLKNLNKQL